LLTLAAAAFASSAMLRACDPLLPVFARDFDVDVARASQTVSWYALTYGLLQLLYGPLADRHGKRRVIGYAAIGCTVGNVLAVFATTLDALVVARVVAAACSAGIIPLVLAWVGDTVPIAQRQLVLARLMTASLTGMIAGQWASGLLADFWGWRAGFGLLAVIFLLAGLRISRDPAVRAEKGRRKGARANHLADLLAVLRQPMARVVLVAVTLEGAFSFSALSFLPAYLHERFGLAVSTAAGIVALSGVGGLAYALAAARLIPRLRPAGLALTGALSVAGAWVLLASVPHWGVAAPCALLAGFGYYMLHNTLTTLATQMAPAQRGTALALFAASLFFGISLGVAAAGLLVGSVGYRTLFVCCAAGMAGLSVIVLRELRRQHAAAPAGSAA
jgi:predicted MFS family arabinose efflux permease